MRVSRLEVFGFKSFMERLLLPLDGGLTAVVGPNGCGKSNIVDAIRWVLGETKASALRGSTLEDVIFNGTETLRPLGLAEVTLTVRAASENLFNDAKKGIQLDLSSTEDSEEVIENEEAVSEDIPSDNEFCLRQNSLSLSGDDFSGSFSGENDAYPQTHEVLDRAKLPVFGDIPTPEQILTRYEWLKNTSEVQITRRLYRSGESEFFINRVPCRLKDIKELARVLGIGARAYTIIAQGEVSRIVSAKPEERRAILEEAAGVTGLRDKIAETKRRLVETGNNLVRLEDIEKELKRQVATLRRQAERAQNREKLKLELFELDSRIYSFNRSALNSKLHEAKKELDLARSSVEQGASGLSFILAQDDSIRGELLTKDVESDGLRGEIDSLKEELHGRERRKADQTMRLRELGVARAEREAEILQLHTEKSELEKRVSEREIELSAIKESQGSLEEELKTLQELGRDELEAAERKLEGLRKEISLKESKMRVLREELIGTESSLGALEAQLLAASPEEQLSSLGVADARMLVRHLSVDPEYVKALEAILGEVASYVVSKDPHFDGIAWSSKLTSGKGFGVIGSKGATSFSAKIPADWVPLLTLVKPSEDAKLVVENLISSTFLVPSIQSAVSYFKENSSEEINCVTKDGVVISRDRMASFDKRGGLIEVKTKKEKLQARSLELKTLITQIQDEISSFNNLVTLAQSEQKDALEIVEKRFERIRKLESELGAIRGRLSAESRASEQLSSDLKNTIEKSIKAENKRAEYERELALLTEELKGLTEFDEEPIKVRIQALVQQLSGFEEIRRELRGKLQGVSSELAVKRDMVDKAKALVSTKELEVSKLEMEIKNLDSLFLERYPEKLEESLSESIENIKELELAAHQLRTRIHREGEVDPESIVRFEEENTRLLDIESQVKDLRDAKETLEKTIVTLSETARVRFVNMFHRVKQNFQNLAPRLFGGGKGSLELINSDDPLEGGVDIMVRPPGKKLKSIDLLSGGEKALTATALIFSIFLERPSPLCVLDEVDAPLDEANLHRFLTLIKELSSKTQFLMITHNKSSMTQADVLVGVTMEEPGASKMISVSLREALSQAA